MISPNEIHEKLSRLMRTKPEVLVVLERRMNRLSAQEGVLEDILRQIEITADRTLVGLGLSRGDDATLVRSALSERLSNLDAHLYKLLGKPDLSDASVAGQKLMGIASKVFVPPSGLFIKHDIATQMLEKYPPHNLMEHFGQDNVEKLIASEGLSSVMSSLRFTQTNQWMHQFFDIAYSDLTADAFEERNVEFLVLDTKWLSVAEKFIAHKHHNVSHLKEFGIIFVSPISLKMPGETMRMFTLILHYLHEVPFYAALIRRHMRDEDFPHIFKSLLRGDVSSEPSHKNKLSWRVVQRYLAKDNPDDFRLFEPHVNPEADHWWRAEEDLGRLSRILGRDHGGLDLGWWSGLDFIGEVFTNAKTGAKELISFDLIDLLMSIGNNREGTYLYHQQEALWNRIFIEYMGRERMQQLIEENLITGFIDLDA